MLHQRHFGQPTAPEPPTHHDSNGPELPSPEVAAPCCA
uniref:Uncharacterized protein n=1 Tax=Arundo donax TaxID=35708 RepID=A0A0A8YFL0_ARUDO